jgi:hypothetical protein
MVTNKDFLLKDDKKYPVTNIEQKRFNFFNGLFTGVYVMYYVLLILISSGYGAIVLAYYRRIRNNIRYYLGLQIDREIHVLRERLRDITHRIQYHQGDVGELEAMRRATEVSLQNASRPTPLSKYLRSHIPIVKYDDSSEQKSCVICMTEFERNKNIYQLPCGHKFDTSCLNEWFNQSDKCPICRELAVPQ